MITFSYHNIDLALGRTTLLRAFSLCLKSGDILWVQGINGIGKTTLLRLGAGLIRPDNGSVTWHNNDTPLLPSSVIAYQSHRDSFKARLTVSESLQFWARLYGAKTSVPALLDRFNLTTLQTQPTQHLSAGQKRRLSLARLYQSGRSIWLLDEPMAALDADNCAIVKTMIKDHAANGGIVMIASHLPVENLGRSTRRLEMRTVE